MNFDSFFKPNSLLPRLNPLACIACVAVFIGLALGGENMTWTQAARWGHYEPSAVWEGRPWALLTSVFVHFEIWHIAFNLYWLWILGNCLENSVGSLRYALFFVGAAWVSSALQLLTSGDQGIGMSGVGYALFGFGWIARRKIPEFNAILDERTILTFLIWMVGCALATAFGWVSVANEAHGAGLLFGALVAALWIVKWKPIVSALALALTLFCSLVPLRWCPLSPFWTGLQAIRAQENHQYGAAIDWYRRTLARGGDASFVWSNLAMIYGFQRDRARYADALAQLQKVDASAARAVAAAYGTPQQMGK